MLTVLLVGQIRFCKSSYSEYDLDSLCLSCLQTSIEMVSNFGKNMCSQFSK